jgi:hypothetical protein
VTQDRFADYDGAYVLGALSPEERDEFEAHLATCDECSARVEELAALPELLALVPAEAYADQPESSDPVVVLLATARARRNRRRWIAATSAAAVAAVLVAGTALITNQSADTRPRAVAPAQVTMSAVAAAPIHATISVADVAWGTSIRLTCTYDQSATYPPDEQYSLVVRSRDGQTENLGTWALVAGKVTSFPAGTALHKSDIATISVDTANGAPLLQVDY